MTLSTIAVHLDHTERCEVRALLAARLAKRHGSHLRGIVPTGVRKEAGMPPRYTADGQSAVVLPSLHLRRRAETVAHVFLDRLRGLDPLSFDVRLVDGEPADAVVAQGRAGDLLIVGQPDGPAAVEDSARRLPEEVMLHAGGAVLILPRTGRFDAVGDKVLVAWDGGREAAFSVRGALPLLRRASQVTLVSAVHAKGAAAARCCREAENWLRRHGIEAAVEQRAGCADFADSLLGCASMAAADLIVMGGYGHARSRERLLGGVTRDVLARACVPVLMAH